MTDQTVTTSHGTAELERPGLTQIQRILYIFTAPSKTFTDILRNTTWWLPFLLSAILSYGFIFVMVSHVGWDKLTENGVKQNPKAAEQMASMPAEQRAQAMKFSMVVTKAITYSVPVIGLIFATLAALVLWGTINFGFGGSSTFGQVFAVWIYGTLPLALQGILGIITMFAGMDPDSFNPQNPVGSNIGYYLSNEVPKWLTTFATSIDIFLIWAMILVGIGLAIVGKVKRSAGLTAVFGWWLLLLIVRMGIAAVSS
jgi:hypothetical protein